MKKNEKDFRKFNYSKTSLQSKRLCEDLERIAIDKKQNIEKIHKEPGQSNRQSNSTTVTDTKEPVTETYVQGGTEIQVMYPTDLYLPTISLQFEQSLYKYLFINTRFLRILQS